MLYFSKRQNLLNVVCDQIKYNVLANEDQKKNKISSPIHYEFFFFLIYEKPVVLKLCNFCSLPLPLLPQGTFGDIFGCHNCKGGGEGVLLASSG